MILLRFLISSLNEWRFSVIFACYVSVVYHQDGVQFELHGDGIPAFLKGSRKGNIFITTNRVSITFTISCYRNYYDFPYFSLENIPKSLLKSVANVC